jgi:hypothetical protein
VFPPVWPSRCKPRSAPDLRFSKPRISGMGIIRK